MAIADGEVGSSSLFRFNLDKGSSARLIQRRPALPFGLFERLLATNSVERIVQETSRLEAFNTLLEQSGVEKDVYVDFVDPTFELLHQLASLVAEGKGAEAEKLLLQKFNEHEVGNAVIMHFRVSLLLLFTANHLRPCLVTSAL